MTIIYDEHGNMFNAEMVLTYENDISEVKVLCKALLDQRNEMYEMIERLKADCEMYEAEFGDPSSGNFEAAFTEVDELLVKMGGEL